VIGYRAPSFSVVRDTLWALDVLMDHGIEYDSSIFPVHHDRYGIPDAPRAPHRVRERRGEVLWELPPVTLRAGGRNLPAAGGGDLRLLPYAWSALAVRRLEAAGLPAVVYTHPWEYDAEQTRFALPPLRAVRHYGRIGSNAARLRRLLRDFRFGTCAEVLDEVRRPVPAPAPRPDVVPASV
jgi:polysaccharide deacetylase family protein (PEP-CTERM system associated)